MSPEHAQAQLTPENLAITTNTLAALDVLSGRYFCENYEAEVRKERPYAESEAIEKGRALIMDHQFVAHVANANGLKISTSCLANSLIFLNRPDLVEIVMDTISAGEEL